jgi:septation ring formation regulator EzrA
VPAPRAALQRLSRDNQLPGLPSEFWEITEQAGSHIAHAVKPVRNAQFLPPGLFNFGVT